MSDLNSKWWDDFWVEQPICTNITDSSSDSWYDLVWQEGYRHWYSIFSELAPGKKMLECGCGSAKISKFMAQNKYDCTLLDCSENALICAKENFKKSKLNANFVIGNINALDFPDNTFDIVYSGGVLEFFHEVEHPIKEMVRVLKPGGVFAANMVPRKFSIQTFADIERTCLYFMRNLLKGQFKDVLKRVRLVPLEYNVNSLSIDDYIDICCNTDLTSVVGNVISPFPELALPKFGKTFYANIMKKMANQWRKFNYSNAAWTKIWGMAYSVHGIKGGSEKK